MASVQFCENNFDFGIDAVISRLKNDGIDVEVESCLGHCGECAMGPFALVNGEFVNADNPDELYSKIKKQM